MSRIRTHYDNLKVSQNASAADIRAAYRLLCHKYHPDRHADSAEAHRIMSLINRSYAVLSDPKQRREHDQWIAEHAPQTQAEQPISSPMPAYLRQKPQEAFPKHYWLVLVAFAAVIMGLFFYTQHRRNLANTTPQRIPYGTAQFRPSNAQYLAGYPIIAQGNRMVIISNQHNRFDVVMQIYPAKQAQAVRTIYLPAHSQFNVFQMASGDYRLRYQQLDNQQGAEQNFTIPPEHNSVVELLDLGSAIE